MPGSFKNFRGSSSTEALLHSESGSDSECSGEGDAEYHVTSAQTKVQRDFPYDENLPSDVATSIRLMETVIDAEQAKLLSDNVNFKWR
ncbi:hypothetical protein EVAR_29984_1 [Eumeta japonica]|uniref:Uncharacterized protein n=1 Tax=Eumeta variegata TaxID=151549 RepID=A0A4C1VHF9_EUMVA|nr:hypothetical protein EVAR_29984_1 [Eumeta japonica]